MANAKYYRFDKVFTPNTNIDLGANDRDALLRRGLSEAMYERQLRAYQVWFFVTGICDQGKHWSLPTI